MGEDDHGVFRRSVLKSGAVAAGALSLGDISSAQAVADPVEPDALVARWPLRDGFSDIVGSHDAEPVVGDEAFGNYQGRAALDFDGSLGVRVSRGGSRALNLVGPDDGPHTVSMWVYLDGPTGGQSFEGTGTAGHSLYKNDTGLRLVATPRTDINAAELRASIAPYGNPDAQGYGMPEEASVLLPTQEWMRVTCVVDAQNYMRLYVDGDMRFRDGAMDGHNGYREEFWSDITLGSWYGGNPEEWANLLDGKLADVRVYETALSAAQIQSMAGESISTPPTMGGSVEVDAAFARETAEPNSRVRLDVTVTNTGEGATSATVTLDDSDTPDGVQVPTPGEDVVDDRIALSTIDV
jgi:hypothetical protein